MFVCIKRKWIIVAILLVVVVSAVCGTFFAVREANCVPKGHFTVVIDAGHGGIDGGCVGKMTGVFESELNLIYAKNLAKQLENLGVSVRLTRSDGNGLYDSNQKNLKKSDMKKRKEIIEESTPELVVSLHMNSFPLASCSGAQTFFKKGNEEGEKFANCVQQELAAQIDGAKSMAKVGDYYIVNCTDIPSVLVECGFLSNPQEEALLQTKSYQTKLCYAIACGIVKYLNLERK